MKRKLALLMAFMMAATLVPAQPADAATANHIDRVINITSDSVLGEIPTTTDTVLYTANINADWLKSKNSGSSEEQLAVSRRFNGALLSNLKIKNDKKDVKAGDPEALRTFELHLSDDSEWLYSEDEATNQYLSSTVSNLIPSLNSNDIRIKKLSRRVIRVVIETGSPNFFAGNHIDIPLFIKMNGAAEGANKVTVVPGDSKVSAGEYTFSNVGADDILLSVVKKEKIARGGYNGVELKLSEVTRTAFNDKQEIQLRLPRGFSWAELRDRYTQENLTKKAPGLNITIDPKDPRDVLITFNNTKDEATETRYLPLQIVAGRDAQKGDIEVTVKKGPVSPYTLVVAEYVGYGVDVKVEKVLDVIAGKDIEGFYKAKLILEEPTDGAFEPGRYIEFKLNKGALQHGQELKLRRKSGDSKLGIDLSSSEALVQGAKTSEIVYGSNVAATVNTLWNVKDKDKVSSNEWDVYVDQRSKTKAKYEVEIPFVVTSDFEGDLVLNVKGAGVFGNAENGGVDVVIAKVKAPVTFEVAQPLPQVKIGLQKQDGADITVKETEASALQDFDPSGKRGNSSYALYNIDMPPYSIFFDKAKIEVTDGNLKLRKDKTGVRDSYYIDGTKRDHSLEFAVEQRSTKASTMKVSNVVVALDRTVPYGELKLSGYFGLSKNRHKDVTNFVKDFEYFTNVTPVSDEKRITTVFKIGEKSFTEIVGGVKEEKTADVAPFIQNNRTMLPLRYVANAIGALVNYDPNTRVATFQKEQTVVSLNIDKDVMYANGSPIKLDSKPANVEGRVFLPIANIAQAFGLKHGETLIWNADNKTVTILPQDATKEEIEAAKAGKVTENTTTKEEVKKEETKTEEKK